VFIELWRLIAVDGPGASEPLADEPRDVVAVLLVVRSVLRPFAQVSPREGRHALAHAVQQMSVTMEASPSGRSRRLRLTLKKLCSSVRSSPSPTPSCRAARHATTRVGPQDTQCLEQTYHGKGPVADVLMEATQVVQFEGVRRSFKRRHVSPRRSASQNPKTP